VKVYIPGLRLLTPVVVLVGAAMTAVELPLICAHWNVTAPELFDPLPERVVEVDEGYTTIWLEPASTLIDEFEDADADKTFDVVLLRAGLVKASFWQLVRNRATHATASG